MFIYKGSMNIFFSIYSQIFCFVFGDIEIAFLNFNI